MPNGSLPVYSVKTEKEARLLIAACCPLGFNGKYYARELAENQTIENLFKFSDRLHEVALRFEANKRIKKRSK